MNKETNAYCLAYNYYLEHGTCSQCVVRAVMEVLKKDPDELLKAAHYLAGGGCLMGDGTCGALAAGQLVLGWFLGRTKEEMDKGKHKEKLAAGKELTEKFKKEFTGITCNWFRRKHAGCEFDMWGKDDVTENKKLMKEPCARMTGTVAQWVVEILAKETQKA
jgi:C_GCAxxG_C_C family probable redox protein